MLHFPSLPKGIFHRCPVHAAARPLTWGSLARLTSESHWAVGSTAALTQRLDTSKNTSNYVAAGGYCAYVLWNTKRRRKKQKNQNRCAQFLTSTHGKVSWIWWWCRVYSFFPIQFGKSHWEPKPHSCFLLLFVLLCDFVFFIYFRFNLLFTSPAALFCLWVCRCLCMSPSGPLSFPHTAPSSVTSKEDIAKANNNKWVK